MNDVVATEEEIGRANVHFEELKKVAVCPFMCMCVCLCMCMCMAGLQELERYSDEAAAAREDRSGNQ